MPTQYSNYILTFVECYDVFVSYIRAQKQLMTTPKGNPKGTDICAIHELLPERARQISITPKTPYTNIYFIRYLFEVSFLNGLLEYALDKKGKKIIQLNQDAAEKYDLLDASEKYFSFFTAFYLRFNFQKIFDSWVSNLTGLLEMLSKVKLDEKIYLQEGRLNSNGFHYWDQNDLFLLLDTLGFIDLEINRNHKPKDSYDKKHLLSITPNNFGQQMSLILVNKLPLKVCNKHSHDYLWGIDEEMYEKLSEDFDFETRHPVFKKPFISHFQHFFSDLETILEKENHYFNTKGNFYFKISLKYDKKIWRIIGIHSSNVMEDLHSAIQEAFRFDDDHCYLFSLDGEGYNSVDVVMRAECSQDEMDMIAEETVIESLEWQPKHQFLYIFDFGDNWEFDCELLSVEASEKPLLKYKILESQGKAPKQY